MEEKQKKIGKIEKKKEQNTKVMEETNALQGASVRFFFKRVKELEHEMSHDEFDGREKSLRFDLLLKLAEAQASLGMAEESKKTFVEAKDMAKILLGRYDILAKIVREQFDAGMIEDARKTAQEGIEREAQIMQYGNESISFGLCNIALLQIACGMTEEAERAVEQITDKRPASKAWVGIALAKAARGTKEEALVAIAEAIKTADKIEDANLFDKYLAFEEIGIAQAKLGLIEEAWQTSFKVERIRAEYEAEEDKKRSEEEKDRIECFNYACKCAFSIGDSNVSDELLRAIARKEIEQGNIDEAIRASKKMHNRLGFRDVLMGDIATAQAAAGDIAGAGRTLSWSDQGSLAKIFAEAGMIESARAVFDELTADAKVCCEFDQTKALVAIAIAEAKKGQFKEAINDLERAYRVIEEEFGHHGTNLDYWILLKDVAIGYIEVGLIKAKTK